MAYDPGAARFLGFAEARTGFGANGGPRAFLERCLEAINGKEPEVRAFVSMDVDGARAAADAADARWRDNRPLSPLDGLPFGVKDCFDVAGLPTRCNSPFLEDAPPALFDAAHVEALRRGGGYVLGKTVTTELTMAAPGPTWNPWDLRRTPGGSSSGSAAAVAAGMLPLGTGSQVRGSGIRPASICGVPGYKPSFGALNRHGGIDPSPSLNHLVLLGATFADIWDAAQQIAAVAGGDPGHAALAAEPLPAPRRPRRLARQYTIGWQMTDDASKAAFEAWLGRLSASGVEIVEPSATPELTAYEDATTRTPEFFFALFREVAWPWQAARERRPDAFSKTMHGHLDKAIAVSVGEYAAALARQDALRAMHRGFADDIDGFVTLAHIGPGQIGQPEVGTPWYNDASSAIGAPTANLPLLAIDDVPLGVQLMGYPGGDADLVAMARWLLRDGGSSIG